MRGRSLPRFRLRRPFILGNFKGLQSIFECGDIIRVTLIGLAFRPVKCRCFLPLRNDISKNLPKIFEMDRPREIINFAKFGTSLMRTEWTDARSDLEASWPGLSAVLSEPGW